MNKGEGLRYAAKAKSGQINLFKEEKKKTKKFSYKSRGQSFPVRKVETNPDSAPPNAPKRTTPTVKNATRPQPGTTKKPTDQRQKNNQKDFVKKNAKTVQSGKGKKETAKTAVGGTAGAGGTVTLTQDQLNAILATIGQATANGVPNISLENGDIKVETKESARISPKQHTDASKSPKDKVASNTGDESILKFINKDTNSNEITPSKDVQNSEPVSSKTNVTPKEDTSRQNNSYESRDVERTRSNNAPSGVVDNKPPVGGSGYGDVSSMVGLNQRELALKKKQQWKKELDEQIALKKQQQGKSGRPGRATRDEETWQPWGQPGGGAPPRGPNAGMKLDLSSVNPAEQSEGLPTPSKSIDPMSSQITPRGDVTSSLGKLATQKYTPAAMRSSFIIGGDAIDNHNLSLKQKEKQQWLQELERQRREAQDRKDQEKRKQRAFEEKMSSHWAEQVTSPRRSQSIAQSESVKPVATVDDSVINNQTLQSTRDSDLSPQRHHSADNVPTKGKESDQPNNQSHARPHGLLVDPVQIEREEVQRQKHLEHMMAVKAQVEEKQRLKREAMEAKKREEAEEERRLAEERDMLNKQFEMEKEKQRKKEEESATKQKAMMESVQAAYEKSQQDKHMKRVQRLASQGHNVDNLRRSWDDWSCPRSRRLPPIPGYRLTVTHGMSPEASPRNQTNHPVRHSPRLEPITTSTSPRQTNAEPVSHSPNANTVGHSVLQQSPRQAVNDTMAKQMQDASTSPVFDQAVQTDFQFPPSDVHLDNVSRKEREKSAGIEYKPDKQPKTSKQKVKGDSKGKRLTKGKSQEHSEEESQPKRTTNIKERPVWGKANQNKKKLGNTQKDLTGNQKKREERRKKRMEELLALQQQNAPKRLTEKKEKKKAASLPQTRTNSVARVDTRQQQNVTAASRAGTSRAATELDLRQENAPVSNAWTQDKDAAVASRSPPSPPIHSGDFVPFLRNDEDGLNERSIPGSPDLRYSQRSRTRGTPKLDKDRAVDKKDPLLNPERLKDSNLRQEKILEQLSNLRQGLMMKQRELEIGLSTTPLVM